MKKTFAYKGENKTNLELRAALEVLQTTAAALADGQTEFEIEYEKTATSTTLTLATIQPPPEPAAKKEKAPKQ